MTIVFVGKERLFRNDPFGKKIFQRDMVSIGYSCIFYDTIKKKFFVKEYLKEAHDEFSK